jgi:hypothetical protein
MTILCLMYLLLDVVGNTVIFSIDSKKKPFGSCYLGVIITVVCQFGFMALIYLRMFRIKSVFSAYEEYLIFQKREILGQITAES